MWCYIGPLGTFGNVGTFPRSAFRRNRISAIITGNAHPQPDPHMPRAVQYTCAPWHVRADLEPGPRSYGGSVERSTRRGERKVPLSHRTLCDAECQQENDRKKQRCARHACSSETRTATQTRGAP